ncbi:Sterol O-acyltransferase 2 (Sterol-ester synthase 2) [Saitoella coloradoensis]
MSSSQFLALPNTEAIRRHRAISTPSRPSEDIVPTLKAIGEENHGLESIEKPIPTATRPRRESKHLFHRLDFEYRLTAFDPHNTERSKTSFKGFFILFWLGLSLLVLTTLLRNLKETGRIFGTSVATLFRHNVQEVAMTDAAMILSTFYVIPIQVACSKGWINWNGIGRVLHYSLQLAWFGACMVVASVRDWSWTAIAFFTLHSIVMLMKIHSYGSYSGHLSVIRKQLNALKKTETVENEGLQAAKKEILTLELTSTLGHVTYPANLKNPVWNYVDYLLVPTLCYHIEYPRTPHGIRWGYVAEKALATFGTIFLLAITVEHHIMPILTQASKDLAVEPSVVTSGLIFTEALSALLWPYMLVFLLVFYIIFECILNVFAEVTCFADRLFYDDWWNCANWESFARMWNKPVHHWLLRHVYMPCRPRLSRAGATMMTFFISAVLHELVMGMITRKVRGYGFFCQMLQVPFMAVQKSKFMRDKELLGNVLFWLSMITGLSGMTYMYVLY